MAHTIEGKYTIKELIQKTYISSKFKNRFDYKDRDSVKSIQIKKIHYFNNVDRNFAPIVRIEITTRSTPRYAPYIRVTKNGRIKQRGIKHQYDITFEIDRMSINSKNWAVMVGSGKNFVRNKVPQNKVHSIFRENLKRWSKEKIDAHRKKKGLYLTPEDYAAQELGVNLDWRMRASYVFNVYGHRLGREYNLARNKPPMKTNPSLEMFAPKHLLAFFEILCNSGILKDD